MRARWIMGTLWAFLPIAALLAGCREGYEREEMEREHTVLRGFIESKGVKPWLYRDILYGSADRGDSLRIQKGDTVVIQYAVYGLRGTPQLLETNIPSLARTSGLRGPLTQDTLYRYVVGTSRTVKGLDIALSELAQRQGVAWVGVPSSMGYGPKAHGRAKPSTPLCYQILFVRTTARPIQ